MKHSKNNVFHLGFFSPCRSLSAVKSNIRLFFRRFKWAFQRAVRGYCDYDIWELYPFYCNLIRETLHTLADTTNSYPQGMTHIEWQRYLYLAAGCFHRANDKNSVYSKPMMKKWAEHNRLYPNEHNPYLKAMQEEAKQNHLLRQRDLDKGLKMISDHFYDLWD